MELKDIPESAVIQQVKQIIKVTGLKIQRINTGCFTIGEGANRRYIKTADAGTCDFEGYDNIGRFVAIECKRPSGGRLSPAQKERIADINRKGGVALSTTGATMLRLHTALDAAKKEAAESLPFDDDSE